MEPFSYRDRSSDQPIETFIELLSVQPAKAVRSLADRQGSRVVDGVFLFDSIVDSDGSLKGIPRLQREELQGKFEEAITIFFEERYKIGPGCHGQGDACDDRLLGILVNKYVDSAIPVLQSISEDDRFYTYEARADVNRVKTGIFSQLVNRALTQLKIQLSETAIQKQLQHLHLYSSVAGNISLFSGSDVALATVSSGLQSVKDLSSDIDTIREALWYLPGDIFPMYGLSGAGARIELADSEIIQKDLSIMLVDGLVQHGAPDIVVDAMRYFINWDAE